MIYFTPSEKETLKRLIRTEFDRTPENPLTQDEDSIRLIELSEKIQLDHEFISEMKNDLE